MRILDTKIHPDVKDINHSTLNRPSTRAIVLRESNILLMYTERYQDYSLPGGGIDDGEDNHSALVRELSEETGANNIRNIREYGVYREYRPWYKADFNNVFIESFCYLCDIDNTLSEPKLEDYEVNNGMTAKWINIHHAIEHNLQTIASSPKKGLSIERETFLLQHIAAEFAL